MRRLSLITTLLLAACDDGSVKLDDSAADDSAADDSAADDSAADDSAADDSAADDSGEPVETTALTFEIEGDWRDTTLSITFLLAADTPEVGETLAAVTVEGATQVLDAPDPPDDELAEVDPSGAPGLRAAYYVPSLHVDEDDDGAFDPSEALLAAGDWWLLFLEGDIPTQLVLLGFRQGWNAVRPDFESDGVPQVGSIDAIPLAINLTPVMEVAMGGTYSAETDIATQRLAAVPSTVFGGAEPATFFYDDALTSPWSIAISGPPPRDHLDNTGELDGAFEVPITYLDVDGSGDLSAGDTPLHVPCHGEAAAVALWLNPPRDLLAGVFTALLGVNVGWSVVVASPEAEAGFAPLSAEDAMALDISGACALE